MTPTLQNPLPAFLICGGEVCNMDGQHVGRIEDVVIDPRTRRVIYAVLSLGGSLEIGGKLLPVPLEALTLNCAGDFVLDMDQQGIEDAPAFAGNDWPDLADEEWWSEVRAYYGCGFRHKRGRCRD